MRAKYGYKLRKFFKENTGIKQIIDFGGYQVFDATVDTNIMMFQKSETENNILSVHPIKDDFEKTQNLRQYFEDHTLKMKQQYLDVNSFTFADEKVMNLKKKIEKIGTPLKDWDLNIKRGITTGLNEAFIIDNKTKEELCLKDSKNVEIIKPILRGRNINRYSYDWKGLWIINSHNGLNEINLSRINIIKDYPVIFKYLLKFKDKLINRDDQGDHWTNLRNCAFLKEFEKEKIVWQEISSTSMFAYDNKKHYLPNTAYFLTGNNIKFLISTINSKLIDFYFYQISSSLSENTKRHTKQYVELIPIPKISKANQQPFIKLVDQILIDKKAGIDTQLLEDQIDLMVYKLYGLTYEEVKIVDADFDSVLAEFGLSNADYERLRVDELGKT